MLNEFARLVFSILMERYTRRNQWKGPLSNLIFLNMEGAGTVSCMRAIPIADKKKSSACKYHYLLEYSFNCRRWMLGIKGAQMATNSRCQGNVALTVPVAENEGFKYTPGKGCKHELDQSSSLCAVFYCRTRKRTTTTELFT